MEQLSETCPICMDCIETTTKNFISTECGHCFHANCLMKSVAHNGFGCPYCRNEMAEEVNEEEEEDDDDDEDTTVYDYDEEEDEDNMFTDVSLRGFRFFFNNIHETNHEAEDEAEEEEYISSTTQQPEPMDPGLPSTEFVAQKLKEQRVTFEDIIDMLCKTEHEEYIKYQSINDNFEAQQYSSQLYGKIRRILATYVPPSTTSQEIEIAVDYVAQPKC
jgi:hypothetical protein